MKIKMRRRSKGRKNWEEWRWESGIYYEATSTITHLSCRRTDEESVSGSSSVVVTVVVMMEEEHAEEEEEVRRRRSFLRSGLADHDSWQRTLILLLEGREQRGAREAVRRTIEIELANMPSVASIPLPS